MSPTNKQLADFEQLMPPDMELHWRITGAIMLHGLTGALPDEQVTLFLDKYAIPPHEENREKSLEAAEKARDEVNVMLQAPKAYRGRVNLEECAVKPSLELASVIYSARTGWQNYLKRH